MFINSFRFFFLHFTPNKFIYSQFTPNSDSNERISKRKIQISNVRITTALSMLYAGRSCSSLVDFGRRLFEEKFCIDMKNVRIRQ